eukprot:TRINITY_DN63416_c0_g1_i1.p1 TRINITY_DN63416_c0_g1~~TRINITY_DN63416_c0_g1_i1.p1  ORF type:complete len:215 (-),score=62.89 TRINITY_DN63416_c0_g1_i1:131-775(-)
MSTITAVADDVLETAIQQAASTIEQPTTTTTTDNAVVVASSAETLERPLFNKSSDEDEDESTTIHGDTITSITSSLDLSSMPPLFTAVESILSSFILEASLQAGGGGVVEDEPSSASPHSVFIKPLNMGAINRGNAQQSSSTTTSSSASPISSSSIGGGVGGVGYHQQPNQSPPHSPTVSPRTVVPNLHGDGHASPGLRAVSYTHLTLPTKRIV